MDRESAAFARKTLIASGIVALFAVVLWLIAQAVLIFLLIFGAILLALFLRALSDWLGRYTRLPPTWSLTVVTLFLFGVTALGVWLLAPAVAVQIDQLSEQLPQALNRITERLQRYQWVRRLMEELPRPGAVLPAPNVVSQVTGALSLTFNWILGAVILVVLGVFLAAQPGLYFDGLIRLFPRSRRARMVEVGGELAHLLRMWLLGRVILMVLVGVLTAAGLIVLEVPLALTLGLIAGVLDFIPNIGPVIAAVPAVVIGLAQDPVTGLYVAGLFVAVQSLEGYLLTPLIVQRTASLPPAMTLIAQVLLGTLFGFVGLFLATPLMIAVMVLVQELYVRDMLEDRGG